MYTYTINEEVKIFKDGIKIIEYPKLYKDNKNTNIIFLVPDCCKKHVEFYTISGFKTIIEFTDEKDRDAFLHTLDLIFKETYNK